MRPVPPRHDLERSVPISHPQKASPERYPRRLATASSRPPGDARNRTTVGKWVAPIRLTCTGSSSARISATLISWRSRATQGLAMMSRAVPRGQGYGPGGHDQDGRNALLLRLADGLDPRRGRDGGHPRGGLATRRLHRREHRARADHHDYAERSEFVGSTSGYWCSPDPSVAPVVRKVMGTSPGGPPGIDVDLYGSREDQSDSPARKPRAIPRKRAARVSFCSSVSDLSSD